MAPRRRDRGQAPAVPLFPLLLALLAAAAPRAALAATSPPAPPPPGFNAKLGGRARRPAQIGTSFVQTSLWDLEADAGGGKTVCETVVDRSKGYGTQAIAIVLTIEARGYDYSGLEQFFYKEGSGEWSPTSPQNVERYRAGLERCARYALSQGFRTIHLLPHVDPSEPEGKGIWRNVVKFDPVKKVGPTGEASSYEEAALLPAARALGAAAAASLPQGDKLSVEFSLGGEQGLSVFSYPRAYQSMVPRLRQAMEQAAGGAEAARQKLKAEFGVSLNWGKVCGCIEVTEQDPIVYNQTFPDRLARWRKAGGEQKVDLQGVRALLESLDWLGTSGYASLPADGGAGEGGRGPAALETSWETLAYEMALMGVPIQDSVLGKGKRLILSEQGIGGCDRKGNVAPDVAWVAKHPFLGLWPPQGGYGSGASHGGGGSPPPVDPWKNPQYSALRRQVYNYLGDWAAAGGGPQYRLDGAYVWSAGTWDVHAAHPVSGPGWAGAPSYGDADIQDKIRRSNAVANAAGSYTVSPPPAGGGNNNKEKEDAIARARAPIPGTKASDDKVWGQAARAASGAPMPPGAAGSGGGGGNNSNNSNNNKPAANNSGGGGHNANNAQKPAGNANKTNAPSNNSNNKNGGGGAGAPPSKNAAANNSHNKNSSSNNNAAGHNNAPKNAGSAPHNNGGSGSNKPGARNAPPQGGGDGGATTTTYAPPAPPAAAAGAKNGRRA